MKVLDHGYVSFVDRMGTDTSIIEAARMSTGGTARDWVKDIKLLRYLWKNQHFSPFEFCQLAIEVKAPLFVVRQWQRHRTQSYNEASARYSPMCEDMYLPTPERMLDSGGANKQAGKVKGSRELSLVDAHTAVDVSLELQDKCRREYEDQLFQGVPKELARLVLPTSVYTKMRVSANLRNWLAWLKLRQDPHAQWEIRQYADAVATVIADLFPHTWKVYSEDGE